MARRDAGSNWAGGLGVAGALILLLGVPYVAVAWLHSSTTISLKHSKGRTLAAASPGAFKNDRSGEAHLWDIAGSAESVFVPESDAGVDRTEGFLSFKVPAGCEGRTIRWRMASDRGLLAQGTLTGKRNHFIDARYPLASTPRTITITAAWDGGDGPCASFGMTWSGARLSRTFDLLFLF